MSWRMAASLATALLVVLGAEARGVHAANLRIELSRHDRYVVRSFTVIRASGEAIPRLATLTRLDREAGALVFGDPTGRVVSVPLSEIRDITFKHTLREQSMAVQAARQEVTAEVVERKTVIIPARDMAVESDALVLPEGALGLVSMPDEVWEASSLVYDGAMDSFRLALERVRYTTTHVGGGGGSSGGTKGLP